MNISFKNHTALITGGLGNIGFEISKTFLDSNIDNLIIIDIKDERLDELKSQSSKNQNIIFKCLDLTDFKTLEKEFENIFDNDLKLDILINNAAFVGSSNLTGWNVDYFEQNISSWNQAIKLNLTAVNQLIKILYPYFNNKKNTSSIINIASIYGSKAPNWDIYKGLNIDNPLAYNVSKAGIIQMTKYLASYFTGQNIRVNYISPGGALSTQNKEFISRYSQRTPLGRMATFEEIGKIAALLSHNTFEYINGQDIIVDGGFSL